MELQGIGTPESNILLCFASTLTLRGLSGLPEKTRSSWRSFQGGTDEVSVGRKVYDS